MGKFCGCCGRELPDDSAICEVCEFDNSITEGESAEDRAERIVTHRKGVVSYIEEIGVIGYIYGIYHGNFRKKRDENIRICRGLDCLGETVWTNHTFGAGHDTDKTRDIELSMRYMGSEGSMVLDVDLSEITAPYRIGVMISEDLKLHFFFGSPEDNIEYVCKFLPSDQEM